MSQKNEYNVISLFSGVGGLDLGFKKNGFKILWANDFDFDAFRTYKKNIGQEIVYKDIKKVRNQEIPKDDIDVLIGGFPCQGFSVANTKRSMFDKRNFLYKELIRLIKWTKPKIFVAENVKGLLSMQNGKVIDNMIRDFENLGYKVDYELLNSKNYNVPQNRERIIIIGNNIGKKNLFPIKSKKKPKTTKQAIGFLKDIDISNKKIVVNNKKIYNHIASTNVMSKYLKRKYKVNQIAVALYLKKYLKKNKYWTIKKLDDFFGYKHTASHWFRIDNNCGTIPRPEDWWKLKKMLRLDNKYDEQVTTLEEKEITFEQSRRITNWNTPSDTITASQPEIHINKNRRLSVRECAILQTFPLSFVFKGSISSMYRQIGNAVPVNLSIEIARQIKEMIDGKKWNRV